MDRIDAGTAGDAVIARWKPFLDDLTRQKNGLTAAVDQFKRKLAAEKEAARRADAVQSATKVLAAADDAAKAAAQREQIELRDQEQAGRDTHDDERCDDPDLAPGASGE